MVENNFPLIRESAQFDAEFMHPSPALQTISKSPPTGPWLYEHQFFLGYWYNSSVGCWWAVPRVCQNSLKSRIFWCIFLQKNVITSLPRTAPFHLCSAPPSPCWSVFVAVCAVRDDENEGKGKASHYDTAFKISHPLKAVPRWRQQGWAVLF